ncbi:hypothetical protein AX16_003246 [Volvariella volvacea WC 439]|nr:hypothetical protein AX16_003246 [Volvariella volvacea WC 439]
MFAVAARAAASRRTLLRHGTRLMSQASAPPPPRKDSHSEAAESNTRATGTTPGQASQEQPLPSSLPSLDFSPDELQEEQPKRTGAKASTDSMTTGERKRRVVSKMTFVAMVLGFAGYAVYMGREWEPEELRAKKMTLETAPSTRWDRTTQRFKDLFDFFNKPAWEELLPPPLPAPHQRPYTLLIDLDDLLITSVWDRQNGWRTAKRPGVDYFLAYLSQFYEVVIFTTQNFYTAAPIIEKLDKYNFFISHRLYRESTRSTEGKIVKDLSYLNRDLSKVIMLDTNPEHVSTHPENSIVLDKWKGDPRDNNLIAMIPFLESIGIYKPADVRPILQAYAGKNIPLEYAKKEAEAKAKHIEEWEKGRKRAPPNTFGAIFGITGSSNQQAGPPPTYLEQKRKEAQLQYLEEQKYIADHKEEMDKMLEQEQQVMNAQVPSSLWEAMDQFKGKNEPGVPGSSSGSQGGAGAAAPPTTPPPQKSS